MKSFILVLVLVLASVCLSFAQQLSTLPAAPNTEAASPVPPAQAPDDVTTNITGFVNAGKYAEAQQLTVALLVAYPNDPRLIKAKALIDRLLAPGGSANAVPRSNQPTNGATPPQAATVATAQPPTGMDKVDYDALIELVRQARQTTDLPQQEKLLQKFMADSSAFLQKHPDQLLLWQLRAATAISLNDPRAGYEAGQTLMAMGAADSNDPNLQRLLGQLKNKGWLDQQGVKKAEEVKNTAAPAAASGTVTVHVYRTRKFVSFPVSFDKPDIYIDGNKMTQIKSGQTIQVLLAPGKHTIGVMGGKAKNDGPISDVEMAAGDEVWVRADYYVSAGGFGRLHLKLSTVPSEQAHSDSAQLEEIRISDLPKR